MAFGRIEVKQKDDGTWEGNLLLGPMTYVQLQKDPQGNTLPHPQGRIADGHITANDAVPGSWLNRDMEMALLEHPADNFKLEINGQIVANLEMRMTKPRGNDQGLHYLTGDGMNGFACKFVVMPLRAGGKWYGQGFRFRVNAFFEADEAVVHQSISNEQAAQSARIDVSNSPFHIHRQAAPAAQPEEKPFGQAPQEDGPAPF